MTIPEVRTVTLTVDQIVTLREMVTDQIDDLASNGGPDQDDEVDSLIALDEALAEGTTP